FWPNAASVTNIAISNPPAAANTRICCFIAVSLPLLIALAPRSLLCWILGVTRGRTLLLRAHLLGSRSRCRHLAVYHSQNDEPAADPLHNTRHLSLPRSPSA